MTLYGLGDLGSETRQAEPIPGIGSALGSRRACAAKRRHGSLIVLPLARLVNLAAVTTGGLIVKKI